MEALESTEGVRSFAGPKDPVKRHWLTARVRVENRTPNQVLPGGHLLPVGVSTVVVLQSDLPAVLAMVEDAPESIAAAAAGFEAHVDREQAEDGGRVHSPADIAKVRAKAEAGEDLDEAETAIMEARKKALAVTAWSVEAEFMRTHNRSIRPLIAAKVLEKGLPLAEVVEAERADADRMRAMFGDLIETIVEERIASRDSGASD